MNYGYVVDPSATDPGDVGDEVNDALSDQERLALDLAIFGPPDDRDEFQVRGIDGSVIGGYAIGQGCLMDFYESYFGSIDSYRAYKAADLRVQDVRNRATDQLLVDPRYVEVVSEWVSCMAESGYEASSPFAGFTVDWPSPRPSESELAYAAADISCKGETELLPRAGSVRAEIDSTFAEDPALSEDLSLLHELFDSTSMDVEAP